jgi:arylformamidase
MDQAELDAAYDQIKYAPNLPQITKRYATNSDAVRARLGAPRRYSYGSSAIEALDVYRPSARTRRSTSSSTAAPGAAGSRGTSGYAAELFVHAGAHYVVPDFINVVEARRQPHGDGRAGAPRGRMGLPQRPELRRRRDRIYVSGHSSGAHLAGVVLTTDWRRELRPGRGSRQGRAVLQRPLRPQAGALSFRSSYVKFTDEIEQALSPQRHLDKLNAPLVSPTGLSRRPNSSASRATSPPR